MGPLTARVYTVRGTVAVTDAAVLHLSDYAHPERGNLVMVVFGASAPPNGALLVPIEGGRFLVVAPDGAITRSYAWSAEDGRYYGQPDPLPAAPPAPTEASPAMQAETAVRAERERQRMLWDDDHDACHPPGDWVQLITEHAGKLFVAADAYTDDRNHARNAQGQIDYRHVLAEIGALALAALEVEYHFDGLKTNDLWEQLRGEPTGGTLAEAVAEEPAPIGHFVRTIDLAGRWGEPLRDTPLVAELREQAEQATLAHWHREEHSAMGTFAQQQLIVNETVAGRLSDIERALTAIDVRVEALENPPAPEVAPEVNATALDGDAPGLRSSVLVVRDVRTMQSVQPDSWTLILCSFGDAERLNRAFMVPSDRLLDMETGKPCVVPGDRVRWYPVVTGQMYPAEPYLEVLNRTDRAEGTTAAPEYIIDKVVPVELGHAIVPAEGRYALLAIQHALPSHTNYFVCWREGDLRQYRAFPSPGSIFAQSDRDHVQRFFDQPED